MSPYIFVLCMERLAQGIGKKVDEGQWKPIWLSRGCVGLTHLCFADDLLVFSEASEEHVRIVKEVLEYFCEFLGAKISKDKSIIVFSSNVHRCLQCHC